MSQDKKELFDTLEKKISSYKGYPLPGINSKASKYCLIMQMVDSIRRIEYVKVISSKSLDETCIIPNLNGFNPLKAAIWHNRNGNLDDAFWLVFLAIHFGKHSVDGWNHVRNVYGKFGEVEFWSWINIIQNIDDFKLWLNINNARLKENGTFSNHRRYQSLDAYSQYGTGSTIESYINWIGNDGSHRDFLYNIINIVGDEPRELFKELYKSMNSVIGFSRLGKFDFLTMIGKLELIEIEPNSTYIAGATGPKTGAEMLFGIKETPRILDSMLADLEVHLGLYFGMQVLEDSICNWQKSPESYEYFRG